MCKLKGSAHFYIAVHLEWEKKKTEKEAEEEKDNKE